MKTKTAILFLFVIVLFQSCKTQQLQSKTDLPKIENQLEGELDYANGGFELVQWPKNGGEITLGSIDKTGAIQFNLPEYDIKANGKNHVDSNLESQFTMMHCKEKKGDFDMMGKPLFKTPYDDVYSQLYPFISLKKYDAYVAYLYPVSDEKMLNKENWDKIVGSKYYWMYIDRTLDYKDNCIGESFNGADLEIERIADVQLKKGWNFIKANLVALQNYGENNEQIMAKKFLFTLGTPESKNVKWYLVRAMDDEKILAAKKEFESQPQ